MAEVRYRDHHAGATPEARIQNRLRNSGGDECDTTVKTGTGAQRVFSNLHSSGSAKQHGKVDTGQKI